MSTISCPNAFHMLYVDRIIFSNYVALLKLIFTFQHVKLVKKGWADITFDITTGNFTTQSINFSLCFGYMTELPSGLQYRV